MSDLDARRIAGRVAALAERLAAVFGAARTGAGGASLLEAATFLRAMAAGIAGQSDDPDLAAVPPPLGRLAAGLALSAAEVDLVLLACMPDEHEGYASVLRAVSPRGEPRPTLGLAAQLLCATPADRLALRHLADGGAAFTSGLLGTGPIDAPFFERSLTVAEGLPGVLAGLTAWPPALGALDLAPVLAGLSAWLEETTVRSAVDAVRAGHRRLVLVTAATEDAALARAAALAEAAGVAWAAFAPSPTAANAREGTERLLALHCLARGVVPVIRLAPPETGEAQAVPALPFLAGPVIVAGRAGGVVVRGGRPVLHVDVGHLPPRARAEAWAVLLPRAAALAPILATRYPVDPAVAAEVAADLADGAAASPDDGATDDLLDRVAASVRVRAHHGLTAGVRLVRPAAR